MKNVHVLPTDKPSRLYIGDNQNFVFGFTQTSIQSRNDCFTNQHIYITSDEEIKAKDYYTHKNYVYQSADGEQQKGDYKNCKKIILTTDKDLIIDGVQAIDDKFLEWFVKNPSCEEIQVKPLLSNNGRALFGYKIIIPKEEAKRNYIRSADSFDLEAY